MLLLLLNEVSLGYRPLLSEFLCEYGLHLSVAACKWLSFCVFVVLVVVVVFVVRPQLPDSACCWVLLIQ